MKPLTIIIAALLACATSAAIAFSAAPTAKPKVIKACAKKKGGALRVAKKCRKSERRVTWGAQPDQQAAGAAGPQGQAGANGSNGSNGTNGANGTDGTAAGETYFDSDGFGSNFGAGGACEATPSGPSITFQAPSGSYVQVMASVTSQRAGANSNTACLRVDNTDIQFSSSVNLSAETRYLVAGSGAGTVTATAAQPLAFPVSAGAHTISMRFGSSGGTSNFSNRNLYVTVFHPAP